MSESAQAAKVDLNRVVIPEDRLLVREANPETRTAGGIVLPEAAQHERFAAEVIKLGVGLQGDAKSDRLAAANLPQPGDTVVCYRYALKGAEAHTELGPRFHIVRWPEDVVYVVKKEQPDAEPAAQAADSP